MKKINITSIVLLAYLGLMGYIGWPGGQETPDWTQYILVIAATLFVILLLRYVQIRRMKKRHGNNMKEGSK